MQIGEQHFEQVSLEEMETILREAAAQGKKVERSPALNSLLDGQASAEVLEEEGGAPSRDHQQEE